MMPKPSVGKKRKTERSSKGVNKPSKKSKRSETRKDPKKTSIKSEKCGHDEADDQEEDTHPIVKELDIDQELDRNASKSSLSVFNVKSIIHHVLSDERVVAMACKAAEADKSDEESEESEVIVPEVEPKLTRSRFREVAQSTGTADPLMLVRETIIQSPLKKVISPLKSRLESPDKETPLSDVEDTVPKLPLVDIKFSEEGESDEEYDPLKEEWDYWPVLKRVEDCMVKSIERWCSWDRLERQFHLAWYPGPIKEYGPGSEDDSESCVSNTSDLASPEPLRRTLRVKRRLLTDLVSSPQRDDGKKKDESTNLSQKETIVSPFKVPLPISKKTEAEKEKENADLIASRTRSQLPLTDTSLESLEAKFVPPDFCPDLYDLINLEELDSEDIDWQKWLFGLTAEKVVTPDTEDPEDSEYNFMAEDDKEEQEEYRTDRAVKVSQRELAELFQEFLSEFGDEIAELECNSLQSQSTAPLVEAPSEAVLTFQQKERLIKQLQQHTQLLVQVNLLAREHPSLHGEAMACHSFLCELLELSEAATNANVCRLLENQNTPPSVFSFVGLAEAARIVNLPFVLSNTSVQVDDQTRSSPALKPRPPDRGCDTPPEKGPPIPQGLTDILVSSPVFVYTGLLPNVGFSPQETKRRALKFLPSEDNLLVLGIAEFGKDWYQIWKNYLPTKTTKQILIRRKNLCSSRAPDNVVKQFTKTGQIPLLPIIPSFTPSDERHRILLPADTLLASKPLWMKNILASPKADTEETEVKKKSGRKRKKVSVDLPVTCIKRDVEKVVRIRPKETTDSVTTAICLATLSETTRVGGGEKATDTRTNTIHVETLTELSPEENWRTTPATCEDEKEIENDAIKPDEKESDFVNDNECGTPQEISSIVPEREPTTINLVSEDENSQQNKEASVDDSKETVASPQTDTQEDTKIRDRAVAFAQSYLNNVKKCLKDDSSTYQLFLKVLLNSKSENWSPAKLYEEVGIALERFPELARDFVGFLEPHHAVEAGVFMTNNEIFRARTFLRRVENHFQKNPSQFQKIIKAFTTFNFNEPKPMELYDAVVPLLKGQQYLIDEFNTFFAHLKPRPSNSEDFEDVELGSGSDVEVIDDFEEVIIPDLIHQRSTAKKTTSKEKYPMKVSFKSGLRKQPYCAGSSRKGTKMNKRDGDSKNDEGSFGDHDKTSECNDATDNEKGTEGINRTLEDTVDTEECGGSGDRNYDKMLLDWDEEGSTDIKIDSDDENKEDRMSYDLADPMSPEERKYESDDDSSVVSDSKSLNAEDILDTNIESPSMARGSSHMTSTSEGTGSSDLSNEACDVTGTGSGSGAQCDYEQVKNGIATEDDPGLTREHENMEKQRNLGDEEEVSSLEPIEEDSVVDEEESPEADMTDFEEHKRGETKTEFGEENQGRKEHSGRISANNLEIDEDGKSVIVWTREDDRKILHLYQSRDLSANIYNEIAQELGNKTPVQVEGRFRILFNLLAESNNVDSSSSSSSEESQSEADDESGEELN